MTNDEAIYVLKNTAWLGWDKQKEKVTEAVRMAVEALKTQLPKEDITSDCISRQAAIGAICNAYGKIDCDQIDTCGKIDIQPINSSEIPNSSDTISRQAAIDAVRHAWAKGLEPSQYIEDLPPAQPEERTEERTETHACDCVSRQAAIDAATKMFEAWYGGSVLRDREIRARFEALPAAEPEDCDACRYGHFGDRKCDYCRWAYPSHYERDENEAD